MTNPKDPAFTQQHIKADKNLNYGLTKREWFAGMAMQGLLAGSQGAVRWTEREFAIGSINLADALIAELNK